MIRWWTRLMLLCTVALVALGVVGFWARLTAGERYLLLDKARHADVDGLLQAAGDKAKLQLADDQRRGTAALRDLSGRAVDAAAEGARNAAQERLDEELGPQNP
ncbi:MAG: hypothetical protein ACO3JL_18550 [Myxococcota bacterium]